MYNRPRIIPVLLIDNEDLVKTKQFKNPRYLGDPINAVKIFNRKGIDEMVILDISATKREVEPDWALLKDIATEAFMPLCYGGGLTSVEQIKKVLSLGYEKVVINTALVDNPQLLSEASKSFGEQSIVASIDAKNVKGKYKCVVGDGQRTIDISPVDLAKKAVELGAGEILINSIDHDGMMKGYDLNLVRDVSDSVNIPVTACGGAGGIVDLKKVLQEGNAHAASGGSMFVYYGKLKAVLITSPSEDELIKYGIYGR